MSAYVDAARPCEERLFGVRAAQFDEFEDHGSAASPGPLGDGVLEDLGRSSADLIGLGVAKVAPNGAFTIVP